MDSENPYASPRYTASGAGTVTPPIDAATIHGARRYGKYLIVRRDAELPSLCAKCGLPANGPLRKWKFNWTDIWSLRHWASVAPTVAGAVILCADWSWYSWIAFFGLCSLSAWLGHRFVQRTTVVYRLCERHEAKRRRMPWFAALFASIGAPAFLAAMVLGVTANYSDAMIVLGVIAAVGWGLAILCAARMGATVEVYRIEGDLVWLKDMPHAFLTQIPEISAAELSDWASHRRASRDRRAVVH